MSATTENRHRKVQGLIKRRRREEASLLTIIYDLGRANDAVVAKHRGVEEVRNLVFVQHRQKLHGAIARLKRQGLRHPDLPWRVDAEIKKSSVKLMEDSSRGRLKSKQPNVQLDKKVVDDYQRNREFKNMAKKPFIE